MVHRVTADMKTVHTRVVMVIFSPSFPKADMQLLLKGMCVWVPAAHCSKANKQARLVERKVYFLSDASNWAGARAGHGNLSKGHSPSTCDRRARALIERRQGRGACAGKGEYAETAQPSLTAIFNWPSVV